MTVLRKEAKRERGAGVPKTAAAPATVTGKAAPSATEPKAWEGGADVTRKPGDLPSLVGIMRRRWGGRETFI
ncbi:hypothetical protein SS37A_27030 [Methylocystis iwaonis]|uniref:Uncharacterized protein n=1 Tax=Methylocystis iwaonis TaxID=2885079 RepID=A0ABM8EB83_9HYPH|nr:hypothetical protein SS37A_27030 [Methylocystis iwaonis]